MNGFGEIVTDDAPCAEEVEFSAIGVQADVDTLVNTRHRGCGCRT